MKKSVFDKIARVMMVAMMATVCMSFMTACGGGDDDPLDNPNPVNNNTNNGGDAARPAYFKPYMVWGSSMDQVSAWMTQYDNLHAVTGNAGYLTYEVSGSTGWKTMEVWYEFFDNGSLSRAAVWYKAGSKDNVNWLIAETERLYGVTLVAADALHYESAPKDGMVAMVVVTSSDECTVSFKKSL